MQQQNTYQVPKAIYLIIVLILAGMYYYSAFVDGMNPEKSVKDFYQAYFSQDFTSVSENMSVFWAINLLPQYQDHEPAELLTDRNSIEKDICTVLTEVEGNNQPSTNLSVEIIPEYTKKGEVSAMVVYELLENHESIAREAAFLILEDKRFRIWTFTPVTAENLNAVENYDISELDLNVKNILN